MTRDAHGVEAVDWPSVGQRVAYAKGDGTGTTLGVIVRVATHDGDTDIALAEDGYDPAGAALDVKRGTGPHTYLPLD